MNGPILLTAIWLVPIATILAILPVERANHGLIKKIALFGNGVNLGLIIWLTFLFMAWGSDVLIAPGRSRWQRWG